VFVCCNEKIEKGDRDRQRDRAGERGRGREREGEKTKTVSLGMIEIMMEPVFVTIVSMSMICRCFMRQTMCLQ
jgi:hypothetical protein